MNPGITSVDINVGLSRSSVGSYTKSLSKEGLIIKLSSGGWQAATGYVASDSPKAKTAMEIAEECIRKMMTTR